MRKVIAALMFFTRLPLWKVAQVPKEYFKNIVALWPLVGWLTAGVMVLVLFAASLVLPPVVAVILAIVSRLLLTCALHEDGLADFMDGFGCGGSKERILSIMKDSHIGAYGVMGLIIYFALLISMLSSLPVPVAGAAILAADPFCKGVGAMIINLLPYARKEEEAKNKTVYSRMTLSELIVCVAIAVAALMWLPDWRYAIAAIAPIIVFVLLVVYMKKKIEGYTGDCCGAVFLLCELSFYLVFIALYQ